MSDKQVESAVSFAAKMIREGTYMGKAIRVASGYYKVDWKKVQSGLSSRSGRKPRAKKEYPEVPCGYCGDKPAVFRGTWRAGYNSGSFLVCEDHKQAYVDASFTMSEISDLKWTRYRGAPKQAISALENLG